MADIISIATALPDYCHNQNDILSFMQDIYELNPTDRRKLKFIYHQSGIQTRYSVIADYGGLPAKSIFLPIAKEIGRAHV